MIKKCRRQNQWETYLCENNNQTKIEPIDYFFPLRWQISGNERTLVKNKLTYARVFIRYKLKDGDN